MEDCASVVARLDVILALAHVAACAPIPYVRPVIAPPEDGPPLFHAPDRRAFELSDQRL